MKEQPLYINNGGYNLFGMVYVPEETLSNVNKKGYVICLPVFEERKSSQRLTVNLAKSLRSKGYFVLLFDYYACGDSSGLLKDASLSVWVNDTIAAYNFFYDNYKLDSLNLIGIRLGAFIAFKTAFILSLKERIIMIEPVIKPEKFIKTELKSVVIKQLITQGNNKLLKKPSMNHLLSKEIDFAGYEISPNFYEDILNNENWLQTLNIVSNSLEVILVNITPTGKNSRNFLLSYEFFKNHFNNTQKFIIKYEKFWRKIYPRESETFIKQFTDLVI